MTTEELEKKIVQDLVYGLKDFHRQTIDEKFIKEIKEWTKQYLFNLVYGKGTPIIVEEDHEGMVQGYDGKWRWL